ncbi:OCIA domain-containing protein 1-like [Diaphorina citri]|uniref:OCIA domain-containing protein 1-like n=1 Tax=Diaphorina citri TaxID=121845 RepID=A0A3Q0IZQ7_DIACI|nr:OCIA domain-containing protein 1-like [Diaphorina citri]
MMEVPNSKLGQILRERRRAGKQGFQESLEPGFGTGISLPSTFSMKDDPPLMDDGMQSSHPDLDDRPYSDFDFQRPPPYDGSTMELSGLPAEPPAHKITYDELRKKNRDEYEAQRSKYLRPPPPSAPPSDVPPQYPVVGRKIVKNQVDRHPRSDSHGLRADGSRATRATERRFSNKLVTL